MIFKEKCAMRVVRSNVRTTSFDSFVGNKDVDRPAVRLSMVSHDSNGFTRLQIDSYANGVWAGVANVWHG